MIIGGNGSSDTGAGQPPTSGHPALHPGLFVASPDVAMAESLVSQSVGRGVWGPFAVVRLAPDDSRDG